jgi:hypothetical protein
MIFTFWTKALTILADFLETFGIGVGGVNGSGIFHRGRQHGGFGSGGCAQVQDGLVGGVVDQVDRFKRGGVLDEKQAFLNDLSVAISTACSSFRQVLSGDNATSSPSLFNCSSSFWALVLRVLGRRMTLGRRLEAWQICRVFCGPKSTSQWRISQAVMAEEDR